NVQASFALGIRKHARRPRVILGVHVIVPQIHRLKNVPICIDYLVVAPHSSRLLIVKNLPLRSKRLLPYWHRGGENARRSLRVTWFSGADNAIVSIPWGAMVAFRVYAFVWTQIDMSRRKSHGIRGGTSVSAAPSPRCHHHIPA